ncbi:MAG TPA: hypothetical protein V6D12_06805, partial [Candidatus Obscuribacterales bacterium]
EALDESVDKQASLLKGEISETRVNLQEDVRNLRTHILEELDRQFSTLRDAKIARDDMAEILFELGMRLKGSEFVRQLKEATDNEIYTGLAILEPNDSSDGSYR